MFFNNMTGEEKNNMMREMMDKCCGNIMSDENKEMMKKMMEGMMGDKKEGKGKDAGRGFNPMEMCQKMMANAGGFDKFFKNCK